MNARLSFERDGTDWPNREGTRFVMAAGLRWHVQVLGEGPVILLVHGTGASTHSFRELAAILSKAFTVVVPDLPGHGFTDRPPSERLSLACMAQSLAEMLRTLGLRPSVVVGHSAGAAIAIQMCLDGSIDPDVVVSINGALLPFNGLACQVFSPLAKILALSPLVPWFLASRAARPGTVEQLIRNTGSDVDAQSIDLYRRLFRTENHVASALGMMANWDLSTLERRLPELRVPLVLVAAGGDRAVPPDQASAVKTRVARGEVVYLRGLGHLAHEERPEALAEIIVRAARQYRRQPS